MYCDLCHVNLCKLSICDHISDEYDKHKIVPILERKKPSLMFPTCKIHSMKKCELQCKLCNVFICVMCLASSEHKGHKFSVLEDIYKTKQVDIKKQTEEMKKIFALTYEEIRNGLINQIECLDDDYENITNVMEEQGGKWHTEIDRIIIKIKKEIIEIRENTKQYWRSI